MTFPNLLLRQSGWQKKASKGREPYRLRKVQTYLYITPLPSPELVGTYDIAWSSQGELDLITGPSIDLWWQLRVQYSRSSPPKVRQFLPHSSLGVWWRCTPHRPMLRTRRSGGTSCQLVKHTKRHTRTHPFGSAYFCSPPVTGEDYRGKVA